MRLLQGPKRILQHASPTDHVAPAQTPGRMDGSDRTAHRHDVQMIAPRRRISADPYTAWLEQREAQREADREREAHRLNPRAAWDDLRSQTFIATGRG